MEKLLRILIVHRQGLADRWWHRLANVLIYGSTLVVVPLSGYLIFSSNGWKTYAIAAYSFESNYASAKGREIDCYFLNELSINCGYKVTVTPSDFLTRYLEAGGTSSPASKNFAHDFLMQYLLERILALPKPPDKPTKPKSKEIGIPQYLLDELTIVEPDTPPEIVKRTLNKYITDDQLMNLGIKEGYFENIKVKQATTILYKALIKNILFALLFAMGWFIFWESIVYRAILYIAYGRQE